MINRAFSKHFLCLLLVALVLTGSLPSQAQDAIDRAGDDTIRIIKEYERSHDAKAIRLWLTKYHGEAPGQEVMGVFAEWAMKHQSDFILIVEGLKREARADFVESFAFALTDTASGKEFRSSFEGYKSKVLTQILAKLP